MLGQNGQASRTEHRLEAGPEAQKQKIAPNRKKVAKKLGFLFLRLANRRDGANPAKDESLTHQNQGIHQESNKNRPKAVFILKYMAGPAGFEPT